MNPSDHTRPFTCEQCGKCFKMKHHLNNHERSCVGQIEFEKCKKCFKFLKTSQTLKRHEKKCRKENIHTCRNCHLVFNSVNELSLHCKEHESRVGCDKCGKQITAKNIKRHIKTIHPDNSEMFLVQKKNTTKKVECIICQKEFYDKSTLNRHLRKCNGKKSQYRISTSENMSKCVLECSTDIKHLLEVHKEVEAILMIGINRSQKMPIDVITKYCEERLKVRVSKDVLEVIISIAPECYRVYIDSRELCIQLTSKSKVFKRPVTPSMILQRRTLFKDKIRENSVSTSGNYVGIRIEKKFNFPELKAPIEYRTAHETIVQHLSVDEILIEDFNSQVEKTANDRLEQLKKKIELREKKKKERELKLKEINFQNLRLPRFAREINALFISEQKNVLRLDIIQSKIKKCFKFEEDLTCLINSTGTWLQKINGYLRKKPCDINSICKTLKQK